MTRIEQYKWFSWTIRMMLDYAERTGIPLRFGEVHRPSILAQAYAVGINAVYKGIKFFWPKVGVAVSYHTYSLAVDWWIIDAETGKKILWDDPRYLQLGRYWVSLGGVWGGNWLDKKGNPRDRYHFQIGGAIA